MLKLVRRRLLLIGFLLVPGASGLKVFPVPPTLQAPGAAISSPLRRSIALDEIFPEAKNKLCDAWNENSQLRAAVKTAARQDFYLPDPSLDQKKEKLLRAVAKDENSSLMGTWKRDEGFPHLTKAFKSNGFPEITGDLFINRLGGLCQSQGGEHTFGSWMDIVGRPRGSNHAWHQDSGLVQDTVMLGFPPNDRYEGPGVFSHIIELSHCMPEPEAEVPGPVIFEDQFPEDYILRPEYKKGAEVLVYRDCHVLHSAPDVVNRVGIWRFM